MAKATYPHKPGVSRYGSSVRRSNVSKSYRLNNNKFGNQRNRSTVPPAGLTPATPRTNQQPNANFYNMRVAGSPRDMANQIFNDPQGRAAMERAGQTISQLTQQIDGASRQLITGQDLRWPGCGGGIGSCGGSGLCIGSGCLDSCSGGGGFNTGGGFGDGNPNTNWNFGIEYSGGSGGGMKCSAGISW